MNPRPSESVILLISSGLQLYREYLLASAAARARAAGVGIWLINAVDPTWQEPHVDGVTVVNVFDDDALAAAARQVAARRTVVGVVCWDEPLVIPAAGIADELGVAGLGTDGVQGCRDKYRTRRLLGGAGLHQPGFALSTTVAEATRAAARIGYPVVVKPRALGASIGVVLAHDEVALASAFGVAQDAAEVGHEPFRGGALIEEYIAGPEISIDGAVFKGEYLPMYLARKQTGMHPYFEELGHVVDAADPLLDDAGLLGMLAEAHRVLGVENGITHTEVKITPAGPLIVEVNGRVGGDLIPYLGRLATGIDAGEVVVDVALGQRPEPVNARRAVAGIRFGYPARDCVVTSVAVPAAAPGLVAAAAMVDPGTELRLPPRGYLARHSYVICEAADPQTCTGLLDVAAELVDVLAEPLGPPPVGTTFAMPAGLLETVEA